MSNTTGIDDIDYDKLIASEWDKLDPDKVLSLIYELGDWRMARKMKGLDNRLIDGSIKVCKVLLATAVWGSR